MSTLIGYCPSKFLSFSNSVTYVFCHLLCHITNWDIMDLNPEYRIWKNQITNWTVYIVSMLQHYQMFIKTPRLVFEYSVDIIWVIKYKQHTVFILVWIVNSFVDLHNYLNVHAMASKFRKHGVRNWAASKNSPDHCSLDRMNPTISFFERENLVHWFANSSMEKKIAKGEKKIRKCFLTNPK